MQTGNRDYFGRNQFWTPSNISITQSIIDDKLNNITLNDNNSSELFTVNASGTAIQTKNNIPLEASQFIITGSNEEIDANENNAVNKRYLSTKINSLDDKYFLKSNIINKDQTPSIDTVYSSDSTKMLLNYKSDKTYVDENLDLKANIDDVYNKTDIDNKVSSINSNIELKANISDVYNKTEIDNKLTNIPTTDNIYTKTEVDNKIDEKISTYHSSSNLSPLNIYSARIRFDEWIPSGDSDFTHDFQIWDSGKKFNCDYLYVTLAFRFMMNCTNWDPMQNTSFFIRQTNGKSGDYSFPVAIAVAGPVEADKSDGSHYYNVNISRKI